MGLIITSTTDKVSVVAVGGAINKTLRMNVLKSNVSKLRLICDVKVANMVEISYNSGDTDELHFSIVDSIDEDESITDNDILYNKLNEIFYGV